MIIKHFEIVSLVANKTDFSVINSDEVMKNCLGHKTIA